MRFDPTLLPGVWIVTPEPSTDARGSFAQTFNQAEFEARGFGGTFKVTALSSNSRAGTLRGLHFQAPPHAETKLVSCLRGAAYDVIVDLRPDSSTFGRWTAVEITETNGRQVYAPDSCAHGFQTLADNTVIHYQLSSDYVAELSRGVRWDDPELAIAWPFTPPTVISERDRALPWLKDQTSARPRQAMAYG